MARLFKIDENEEVYDAGGPEYGDSDLDGPMAFRVMGDVVLVAPDEWEEEEAVKWLQDCDLI